MFANLLSGSRSNPRPSAPDLRTVNRLGTALSDLPGNWIVLRNRRAAATDGPPWVKYIALNPEKGIALVDFLPAQPEAAIAPLEEFLARTGYSAFSRGDPPIVAVALTPAEIPMLHDRVEEAFAAAPRCGIKNENWPTAIAELLMSTQGLLLTQLESSTDTTARKEEPAAKAAPASEPTAPMVAPAKSADAPDSSMLPRAAPTKLTSTPRSPSAPRKTAATPKPTAQEEPKAELPRPVDGALASPPLPLPLADAAPKHAEASQRQSEGAEKVKRAGAAEPPRARRPKAAPQPKPLLAIRAEGAMRDDRPLHVERRERPVAIWVFAASLTAVAAAAVLYYPYVKSSPPGPALEASNPPSAPPTNPPLTATVTPPPTPAPQSEPLPTRDVPAPSNTNNATNTASNAPAQTEPPPPDIASFPHHNITPAEPISPPAPAANGPLRQAAPPDTGIASNTPMSDAPARAAKPKRAKAARAKPPVEDDGSAWPSMLPPAPAEDDTVTIDGTTYVKGREPRALGTLPNADDASPLTPYPQSFYPQIVPPGGN